METIGSTEEYHKVMGIDVKDDINLSNVALNHYRINQIANELFKLKQSMDSEDTCSALEYISNIQIELNSTILLLGMRDYVGEAFKAVHAANMTKLDNNGNPVIMQDGKIAEGDNYEAPSMHTVMEKVKKERYKQ